MEKKLGIIKLKDILDTTKYNTDVDIQRNFIWDQHLISALIESIKSNISLGEIKAWKNNKHWDIIDGKQRLTTIREFVAGNLEGPNKIIWSNWTKQIQNEFLNQEISIAYQEGTFSEKVKAYININGCEPLTDWEKIHALCFGNFIKKIEDAFTQDDFLIRVFGGSYKKTRGESCLKSMRFLIGLDTPLDKIRNYLNLNRDNDWNEYEQLSACCKWTIDVFGEYGKDLDVLALIVWKHKNHRNEWKKNKKQVNNFLKCHLDNKDRQYKTCSLYVYYCNLLKCWNKSDLDPKRFFDPNVKYEVWKNNRDKYPQEFEYYKNYQMDHILSWSRGGKTIIENCQLLTPNENASKGNKNLLDE